MTNELLLYNVIRSLQTSLFHKFLLQTAVLLNIRLLRDYASSAFA